MGVGKRAIILSSKDELFEKDVGIYYANKGKSPHCMMELSAKEWVRYKDNSIVVGGLGVCNTSGNTEVLYSNVEYGKNVKYIKRRSISNGKPIHWNEINLSEMKGSFFMITTKKEECSKHFTNNVVFDTSNRQEESDKGDNKYHPSGFVVLCICNLEQQGDPNRPVYGTDFYKAIHGCKNNIITSHSNHFGSSGCYYSFGNKGNYMTIDNSTVGQYASKRFATTMRPNEAKYNAELIENQCALELDSSVKDLVRLIPNMRTLIAPILDLAFKKQASMGSINLKEVPSSCNGLGHSAVL